MIRIVWGMARRSRKGSSLQQWVRGRDSRGRHQEAETMRAHRSQARVESARPPSGRPRAGRRAAEPRVEPPAGASTRLLLRELVAHLRRARTRLRVAWAQRLLDARLLSAMRRAVSLAE